MSRNHQIFWTIIDKLENLVRWTWGLGECRKLPNGVEDRAVAANAFRWNSGCKTLQTAAISLRM